VREVLEEEDEDQEGAELGEVGSRDEGGDGDGEQGSEVEREDAEGAADVEVAQPMEVWWVSQREPVMRKPERAKKRTTPHQENWVK
jgi:hypothetical protein